ncbi:NYN domain-containing protein [Micromonospora fluostatini]|uniref:hypothetical protein n=1 Tax=Micromonospora sp. JCM 30529 TaxID=3421643 RepID=UPI003D16965D
MTHARNAVADVFVLVPGDDDLTEAVEEAQVHGVQVILLAVPKRAGPTPWHQPASDPGGRRAQDHVPGRHRPCRDEDGDTLGGAVTDGGVRWAGTRVPWPR